MSACISSVMIKAHLLLKSSTKQDKYKHPHERQQIYHRNKNLPIFPMKFKGKLIKQPSVMKAKF
jgi:hypothetical protein